ncbi:MAG: hypothetical protein MJ234_01490 [bacterium]|nr:hypothetical protein [bacterium]
MLCLMCGHDNPETATVCMNCKTPIHKLSQMTSSAPPAKVTDRYMQIKAASDSVLAGAMSIDDYARFLHDTINVLAQKEQEIREVEIPEESYEEFADELNMGYQGIDMYNEGLEFLLRYTEDGDPVNISHGMGLIFDGNERINEAMRINRENRRKIEEEYIEISSNIM